jgi:hypothetical protein
MTSHNETIKCHSYFLSQSVHLSPHEMECIPMANKSHVNPCTFSTPSPSDNNSGAMKAGDPVDDV